MFGKFTFLLIAALVALASATVYLQEGLEDGWRSRWVDSEFKSDYGKWEVSAGEFYGDAQLDKGLKTSQDARFYSTSTALKEVFDTEGKDFVLQFSVKHAQNIDCGGGYVKLLPPGYDAKNFHGETEYTIMAGPDICGPNKRIHFIFNYKGSNLLWKKEPKCESDTLSHLYTFIVHPDGTYAVKVDGQQKESGRLEEDWSFLPPQQIPDPEARQPADWVTEAQIVDPEDVKPADWDESAPEMIRDTEAQQPETWDTEEDGEWEAPMISNPDFKGKWTPRRIPNPAYKGEWKAPMIANPDYAPDSKLGQYKIAGLGVDIWQVKSGSIFDNFLMTDSVQEAEAEADEILARFEEEKKAFNKAEQERRERQEAERKQREEEDKKRLAEEEAKKLAEESAEEVDASEEPATEEDVKKSERKAKMEALKAKLNKEQKDEL